ncbi:MAG: 3-oxoacyl-ACP reductase FabG [Deferribacteraceae bacterium]|jgi:3-oxoacyl-[acyl-carrier protein] reductase|nr:3-oxoacyl-ACP reductase FabG [Deferribacteraceae bacterium]
MAKWVLITGSSRGIGRTTAIYLAKSGYDIVLHFRSNVEKATDVKNEIISLGRQVRMLQFDVNNRKACEDFLKKDVEINGAYYAVICNAGITADAPFPVMSEEDWSSVINTSLNGFYNILQPIIMDMVSARKPGRIVTLASVSGITGNRGQVNYSAAKAGVIGATKALAVELAKHKITVNCVAPGLIKTDMTENIDIDAMNKIIPMKRIGKPEEVASLIAYLLSDDAAYITRQVISVNGGLC